MANLILHILNKRSNLHQYGVLVGKKSVPMEVTWQKLQTDEFTNDNKPHYSDIRDSFIHLCTLSFQDETTVATTLARVGGCRTILAYEALAMGQEHSPR